jgi:CelD/BcsL family acetyltransferase involved in cellulose biosynthesis
MDMAAHPLAAEARPVPASRAASWEELARDAAEANAFYAPDMLCAALDHLAGAEAAHVVEAWEGEELIGLLPVSISPRHGRLPIACVTNWMHEHAFFGAPILRRGRETAAWAALLRAIETAPWARGVLHLRGIDAAGASAAALEAVCVEQRRGLTEIHRYDRAMLRSDLPADAYWEANMRSKKRKEIRRLQKRLAELGAVEERMLADPADLDAWCDAFLALEASGWKGQEGTALADDPAHAAFFRQACAAALAAGRLHFLRIDLDGAPIAMLANFRHGEGAFSFKIAIDEAHGRFSPGVLIELFNLHAVQDDPVIAWMDSCAAPGHPMIDSLWAERRSIAQYRVALTGSFGRKAAFALANAAERLAARLKGQS